MEKSKEVPITLRPFELTDIDDFMLWASDDRVAQWCFWDAVKSREDAQPYLERSLISHPWERAVCLDGRPIGQIKFDVGEGIGRCRGMIGCALARTHCGKGIATPAVKMALSSIFLQFPQLQRIEALAIVGNIRSQRGLEKAGFVKEGLLRKYLIKEGKVLDVLLFSILASEHKGKVPYPRL